MRHSKRFWRCLLQIDGSYVLPSLAHGRSRQLARPAVSVHTHSSCPPPPALPAQAKYRHSSATSQATSGLRVSQELLWKLETSVSGLDSMVGQLNDTSSLKADQIRDLQRQVNRLEPVSALISEHRHIESEVLCRLSCLSPRTENSTD